MKMFLGEYAPTMTSGSRLALPSKLRELIAGSTVILAKGFEKCIFVYDVPSWGDEAQKHAAAPITDPDARAFKRYMFGGAHEVSLDSQGRFVIPQNLLEYAGLATDVIVIGAGDHIEIWDKSTWDIYMTKVSADIGE